MATRTISLSDLKVGMYLRGVDRSRLHRPFLRHKFEISAQSEIDMMRGLDLAQEPEGGRSLHDIRDPRREGIDVEATLMQVAA